MAAFLTAAVASFAAGPLALRLGSRIGLVDRPDGSALKVHARPAVLLGIIPVLGGVIVGTAVSGRVDAGLIAALVLLGAIGAVDDARTLPPVVRLGGEALAGGVIWSFAELPAWTSSIGGAVIVIGLTVVAVNAVNLIDGLDLLSSATTLVTFGGLALIVGSGLSAIAWSAVGALTGFAFWNRPPARLFLGDGGAYVVGGILAYLTVSGALEPWMILSLLLAWGILLGDLGLTLLRRRLGGRALFEGDRSHLYDQLVDRGWSLYQVVFAAVVAQIGFVGLAWTAHRLGVGATAALAVATAAVWVGLLTWLGFVRPGGRSQKLEIADREVPGAEVGDVDRQRPQRSGDEA